MKALNWFQARGLARLQRRAIRREGWEKWLLYRFKVWLISETVAGLERRRVARAEDFRDSEFLAKDWTDEPWEGATTPPCTTLPPAPALPGNDTGGAGVWTIDERCGGDGEGGNVPPIVVQEDLIELEAQIFPVDNSDNPLVPDGGGGTCWVGAIPAAYIFVAVRLGPGIPAEELGGDYVFYLSETGADLSGSFAWGELIAGVTRYLFSPSGQGPGDIAEHFDASWDAAGWPNFAAPATNLDPIAIAAGATITARIDYRAPSGNVYTVFAELALAPAC
jgi:hypothetical protein